VAIRVVLAEDNVLLREGVSRLVEREPDLDLVGTAGDMGTLLDLVEEVDPDVIITDIRMPPTGTDEGIQIATRMRAERPDVGVVVLSQYVEPSYALALLAGGSEGRAYLVKERVSDVGELLAAVRSVAAGGSVIDPKVVEALVNSGARSRPTELDRLSPREREVLAEMAQGKTNSVIAATLVLSDRAVVKHINSIFTKLNLSEETKVSRRVMAVLMYLDGRKDLRPA
jgi:DNA-binding NarL/FixJ family response regulator